MKQEASPSQKSIFLLLYPRKKTFHLFFIYDNRTFPPDKKVSSFSYVVFFFFFSLYSSNTRRASEEDPTFDLTTATGEASTSFLKEVFAAPKNCTEDTKARTSVAAAQSFSSQQFAARSTAVNTCRDEVCEMRSFHSLKQCFWFECSF